MKLRYVLVSLFVWLLVCSPAGAEPCPPAGAAKDRNTLWLPKIFSAGMVLQKGRSNPIWGRGLPGEQLHISLAGKTSLVKVGKDGRWMTRLAAMDYGGPYTLRISGKQSIELDNVMIGEVWLCSGQSNMGLPLEGTDSAATDIASADYPMIRLFNVGMKLAQHPQEDVETGHWQACSPATVKKFSALAYFFGRELYKKLHVAIGLIHSSVGGTYIENWMGAEVLRKDPDFSIPTARLLAMNLSRDSAEKIATIKKLTGGFPVKDEGLVNGKAVYADPDLDLQSWIDLPTPAPWNPLFGGIGWCRREFFLTDEEARHDIEIHLSRIDDDDITYLNGSEIGTTQNVGDRIYKTGPPITRAGRNVLVCRIRNRGGSGGMLGKADEMYVQTASQRLGLAGTWKFRFSEVAPWVLSFQKNDFPTILFNGMIAPLMPYGIKGILWYQGEANTGRALQYQRLFPALIRDWRKQWGEGDMPFVFVSLSNFGKPPAAPVESSWAALREAQARALLLPNTAMAVTIDLDEDGNLHPPNKRDVGKRTALGALKIAYGKNIVYASPIYKDIKVSGSIARLRFDAGGSGLMVKGGATIRGFAIAGEDKKFYWAEAKLLDAHTVELRSDSVRMPVAVRYAWADNPAGANLCNKEGLPVNSFRTDKW